MARISKTTKRKAKVGLSAKDYRFPGESSVYWTALAGMVILFVWIFCMGLIFKKQASGLPDWRWLYLFLWPLASVFLANMFSAKGHQGRLKKAGPPARVLPTNYPSIHARLSQQCQLVGLKKPPQLYIVEDESAFIFSLPGKSGTIISSKPLVNALTEDEYMALVAREVGLLAAHDIRVGLALVWVRTANPLFKLLCLPLLLMAVFLRGWADLAEFTGDRASVLLMESEGTLNLALIKMVIAQDPNTEVQQEDLEAYMRGSSDIGSDSKQLERHFRIGKFIEASPHLKERIEQVQEYRSSKEGKVAFAKRAEVVTGG